MKYSEGETIKITHKKKGIFKAIVIREFDSEYDDQYIVSTYNLEMGTMKTYSKSDWLIIEKKDVLVLEKINE